MPAGIGRPPLLTPELQDAIAAEVRAGCRFEDAAEANGITRQTIHNWIARGEAGEEPFDSFFDAITRARAAAKRRAVKNIRRGRMLNGDKDWKAEAWFLERTFPAEYGQHALVHAKVESELRDKLGRLEEKLGPDVYKLVLSAIADEAGGGEAGGAPRRREVIVEPPDGAAPGSPEPTAVPGKSEPPAGQ